MRTTYRKGIRVGGGVVLLALGLAFAARPALAQYPPAAPAVKAECFWTGQKEFKLPIMIQDKDRAAVREVQLYAKEPDGTWQKKAVAPPTQKEFLYFPPRDGEYYFSVVTVDVQGRANPADVTRQPPDLIVVVDKVPPQVDVLPTVLAGGQSGLRCTIKDENPDYQKLQLSYRPDGQAWQTLEQVPGSMGLFRLPPGASLNGTVRWQAEDKAHNKNSQEITFREQAPPSVAGPVTSATPPAPLGSGSGLLVGTDADTAPPLAKPAQDLVPVSTNYAPPVNTPGAAPKAPAGPPCEPGSKGMESPCPYPVPGASPVPPVKSVPAAGSPSRQLINTQCASIEYRVDKVGPSGVSKVDVWVKGEKGGWQRVAVDTTRKGPALVQLPHDGLFGIRLAVTNGNGFGGNPPQPGDTPAYLIEVDTTPPFAQLHPVGPVTSGDVLDIRWTATDKNLGPEPVHLFWATQPNGPWQPIAPGLANSGQYAWHFPRDIGPQFYVRLEVVDEAGNVTRSETNTPVQLDLSEPQAQVVGVTPVAGKN